MPTRWYLPSTGAAPVSPAFSTEWNGTTNADRLLMVRTKISSAMGAKTYTKPNSNVSNQDFLWRQYVSEPLAAQTISGTVKGRVRASENNSSHNARMQVIVRVVSNDGSTVRGTLYGGDLTTGTSNPTSEFTTTSTAREAPRGTSQALTSVTAQDGDRIVVEYGFRVHTTATTAYTATAVFEDGVGTDLPENQTATSGDPWIEFSGEIAAQGGGEPAGESPIELVAFEEAEGSAMPLMVSRPAGVQNGDVVVLAVAAQTTSGLITPSGFTSSYSTQTSGSLAHKVWTKVVTNAAGEPSAYAFNHNGGQGIPIRGIAMVFRHVDTSSPVDVTSLRQGNAASTTVTAPSLTTATQNALVLWFGAANSTTVTTTAIPNGHDAISMPTTGYHLSVASMYQTTAGATGAASGTISESVTNVGGRVALRPLYPSAVPGGGGPSTVTRTVPQAVAVEIVGPSTVVRTVPQSVAILSTEPSRAIALVSYTDNHTLTQPLTIARPADVQDGDVLVLVVAADQGTAGFITPSGFTSVISTTTSGTARAKAWFRVVTSVASESTSYTFNDNAISAVSTRAVLMAFRYVDPVTPEDGISESQANAAGLTVTAPSVVTETQNALVVWAGVVDSTNVTTTLPAGHTTIVNPNTGIELAVGYQYQTAPGATGAAAGTLDEAFASIGIRIPLKPLYPNDVPGGGGGPGGGVRYVSQAAAVSVEGGGGVVEVVLTPTDDTYVNYELPDANYGSSLFLSADTIDPDADAWLKFHIPEGGAIQTATLRMYLTNGTSGLPPSLEWVPADWDEMTLTANNAPAIISQITQNIPGDFTTAPGWIEVSVSSVVTSGYTGDVAFQVHGRSSNGVEIDSKEGSNPPQLVLQRVDTGLSTEQRIVPEAASVYAPPYVLAVVQPVGSWGRWGAVTPVTEASVSGDAWAMVSGQTVSAVVRPDPLNNWDEDRTIFVVGDVHVGNTIASRRDVVTADVTANLTGRVDRAVQTGDLTQNAYAGEVTEGKAFMNGMGIPWKIIGGNHDYYSSVTQEQFESTYNTTRNWYQDIGPDIRLIGLSNTGGSATSVVLDATALAYLDARLAETTRNCIIFCHAPLYQSVLIDPLWPSSNGSEESNRHVVPVSNVQTILNNRSNARAWLSGHTHSALTAPQLMMAYPVTGGTLFAMNVSAYAYPGKGTDSLDRALAAPLVTVLPNGLEVRWRDHKTNGWHTVMGNQLTTYTWDR